MATRKQKLVVLAGLAATVAVVGLSDDISAAVHRHPAAVVSVGEGAASPPSDPLAGITVAPEGSIGGYSRDQFGKYWGRIAGCSTRTAVLKRDLKDVSAVGCRVNSGTFTDPYDGTAQTYTAARATSFDIDHVVALAEAWRSGASGWSAAKRFAFANDLDELLVTTDTLNKAKSDRDAGTWAPPAQGGPRCHYAMTVRRVKAKYGLTIDPRERTGLLRDLDNCG